MKRVSRLTCLTLAFATRRALLSSGYWHEVRSGQAQCTQVDISSQTV